MGSLQRPITQIKFIFLRIRCQPTRRFLFVAIGMPMLLVAATTQGVAQLTLDADQQFSYAQSRFEADAFDEAIVEFNRFIYFFPADPRIDQARLQTGKAHFSAGRFQAAAEIFKAQITEYTGSPLQTEAFFMLSRSHARQGMTEQAILDLRNLMAIAPSTDVVDRARYELGWLQVDQGRWKAADQVFNQITPDNRGRFQVDDVRQALTRSDAILTKNPAAAGWLSIIPGGGQLYCARYQDALTAFLINAGLIWAAWESFDNEQYALGSLISFVGVGFYAGNITGAISSAHKYNRDQIDAFRQGLYRRRSVSVSIGPVPGGAALCWSIDF